MKQDIGTTNLQMVDSTSTSRLGAGDVAWASTQAYHELADIPVREVNLLESVEANLAHLEELQARLRFMVREVKYLMKI
ncbi:MAG: hypothetical protein KF767_08155 [Bdellovibrionaceae bacterium]|nr:hypothetical protein [Pseudobdellovibrionaceae bacterium]